MKRLKLLLILATMPDEALGYFIVWANGGIMQFPDGLGGFTNESAESIKELRKEAKLYMGGK